MNKIKITKLNKKSNVDLEWTSEEEASNTKKILALRDGQIIALFFLVGIEYDKEDVKNVILEIRENKTESMNLGTLMTEADSKKNLLWWIDFFGESK